MTIGQFLRSAQATLEAIDIDTARLDSLALLESTLGISKAMLLAHQENTIDPTSLTALNQLVNRRASRTPLAYLLGSKEFYGRIFKVSNDTLIPRPETESMIELALSEFKPTMRVFDIGTGSGILGITLALETGTKQRIVLTDTSQAALSIARQNANFYSIEADTIMSDLLTNIDITDGSLVFANLPYVPEEDKDMLYVNELATEPASAIFADEQGLAIYRRLFAELAPTQCFIVAECMVGQLEELDKLAQAYGFNLKSRSGLASLYSN